MVDVAARHPRPAVLAVATAAAIVARGTVGGDERAWPYLIVFAVLAAAVAMVAAGGRMSRHVVWALAILGAVHVACGLAVAPGETDVSLYEHWVVDGALKLDQLVHASGTAVVTVAIAEILGRSMLPTAARLRWVMAGLSAIGVGALNEVFEFVMAQRIDSLRIGDGANTGWDLVFNLAGATAVILAACLAGWGRQLLLPADDEIRSTPLDAR